MGSMHHKTIPVLVLLLLQLFCFKIMLFTQAQALSTTSNARRLGLLLRPRNQSDVHSSTRLHLINRPASRWMSNLKPSQPTPYCQEKADTVEQRNGSIDNTKSSTENKKLFDRSKVALPVPPAFSRQRRLAVNLQHHHAIFPFLFDLGTKAVLGTAGIAAGLLGLLYWKQESLLYMPQFNEEIPRTNSANPSGYRSPKEYNLPYEEAWIKTEDGVEIHTWLLLKDKTAPTIVFFHGNAGNIGIRLPNAEQMYNRLNCNVFMVEYRGYGDSRGDSKPTEHGLKLDGEAAVRYIQNHSKIDPSKIVLFGRSLGGAVTFHVAQTWQNSPSLNDNPHAPPPPRPPLAAMIVENTFCSIDEMADILFPFLSPVKGLLLRMHWNSKVVANSVTLPILYLAGEQDEIVPPSQMRDLFQLSKESSTFAIFHAVPSGMHNDTWLRGGDNYWKAMFQFIQKVT